MSLSNIQASTPRAANATTAYDLVVVGFGTTGLSLATALADHDPNANILFLEKQSTFTWQPAHVLPENAVRTSFLRDLVTSRNPRSRFTFINYLHETDQLVQFTNLSQLAPSRLVMGNYFSWLAERVAEQGWVRYNSEVLRVKAAKNAQQQVSQWQVDVRDPSGHTWSIASKRVVLATGSKPRIPASLASPQFAGRVLHSSASAQLLDNLKDQTIAIVGSDQEAAEIFEHVQSAGAQHRVRATMFIPDSALRPEENNAFIQDIIDDRVPLSPNTTSIPPELRTRLASTSPSSQHPRVALHTIEKLYELQYAQKIRTPNPKDWRFQLQNCCSVVSAQPAEGGQLKLVTKNEKTGETRTSERAFDVVIAAGGYEHEPSPALISSISEAGLLEQRGRLTVDPEYRVNFRREALAPGCGLWCLGSLEEGKVRDDALGYAAERAHRCLKSVLAAVEKEGSGEARFGEVAML